MNILILYQDIQSGAKIATESVVSSYQRLYPNDRLVVYKQHANPYTGSFTFLKNAMWSAWDFWRVMHHTKNIDVIFSALYTFALPWRMSPLRDVPAVFQIHGDQRFAPVDTKRPALGKIYHRVMGELVSLLQSYALRTATRVAFVSTGARESFLRETHQNHLFKKTFILPNGVDLSLFRPSKNHLTPIAPQKNQSFRVSYVGRMDVKKGIHVLIASLSHLSSSITLIIAYPQPTDTYSKAYLVRLLAQAKTVPARHQVLFRENPKNILELYQQSDVLVLPSRQEMLPLVILEALACGVIPIANNVGGVKEVLMKVSPLLLLSSVSAKKLAQKIRLVRSWTNDRRSPLIRRGILVAKQYSWEKSASILYNEVHATQHE